MQFGPEHIVKYRSYSIEVPRNYDLVARFAAGRSLNSRMLITPWSYGLS